MRTRAFFGRRPLRCTRGMPVVAVIVGLMCLPSCGLVVDNEPQPTRLPISRDANGTPFSGVLPHWNALLARSPATPAVRWGVWGTPTSLFGDLSPPRASAPGDVAHEFLLDNARLLQLSDDLAELVERSRVDSLIGTHITFAQHYEGVPVFGAEVKVHVSRDGRVIAMNNTTVPGLQLDVQPKISAERALDLVLSGLPAADRRDAELALPPELVIDGDVDPPALAYRVVVSTVRQTLEFFVNAKTEALLGEPSDLNRYVNGMGSVFKDNAVVATGNNNLVDNNDAASAVPSSAYSIVTLQGLAGNNQLDGQFASGSGSQSRAVGSNNNFLFLRDNNGFSETMAYFHIDFAERYIQSLGFTSVNNRQQVFSIDQITADNSFYSPSTKAISYGTGGVDDAEDGEVIIHEYGHSIQDNQVPGWGATEEGGAMGEGFGDYFAASVNGRMSSRAQFICIAEWDATSYASGVPHWA
jgi:Zn-dependent metalloprotease